MLMKLTPGCQILTNHFLDKKVPKKLKSFYNNKMKFPRWTSFMECSPRKKESRYLVLKKFDLRLEVPQLHLRVRGSEVP